MRKLFLKWVPRLLTVNQKQPVGDSEHCLGLFWQSRRVCVNLQHWKLGSTITCRSQIDSQPSGQQLVNPVQSGQNSSQDYGICILGCVRYFVQLPWKMQNSQWWLVHGPTGSIDRGNLKESAHHAKKKSDFSPGPNTVSRIIGFDGKIERITLQVAFPATLFS